MLEDSTGGPVGGPSAPWPKATVHLATDPAARALAKASLRFLQTVGFSCAGTCRIYQSTPLNAALLLVPPQVFLWVYFSTIYRRRCFSTNENRAYISATFMVKHF
jgi:hypothetical protein